MTPDYSIIVKMQTGGVSTGRRVVESELSAMDRAVERTKGRFSKALTGAAIGGVFLKAVKDAAAFGDKMAEVSTLVDETTFDMDALTKSALDQAKAFGSLPAEQAAAQYQIISAGAGSAAEATEILTAANKLAVGGVTDVATASDGLTSVLNAYGDKVAGASAVSDAMFVGMKAGKTTIGELSGGLGKVAPLAAQAGVSFDELVAATSALTKGGISTRESITGVRAILAAVTKPTSEAEKLAAKLGLSFNAAALESQGFAGFMQEVVAKTGGSSDAMAQLFGGVEALVPALALSGQAGVDFAAIMEQMKGKAGETEVAFDKVSQSAGFKWNQFVAQATTLGIQLGGALLTILLPALNFVTANFDTLVPLIGAAVAGFVAYRSAVILSGLATTLFSGQLGVMLGIVATTTRTFGVAAGAQVLFAGATAGAGVAMRGLTAAIIASPLAPLAIALTAAGAAYLYFTGGTESATDATLAKAEADRLAMEREAQRAQILGSLAQATAEERAQTIAAMKAAVAKANADIQAAKAALQRASAERELVAAMGRKAQAQIQFASRSTAGAGSGFDPVLGAIRRNQGTIEKAEQVESKFKKAERLITQAEKERDRLNGLIADAEKLGNVSVPSVGGVPNLDSVSGGSGGKKGGSAANDNEPRTTFAKIKSELEQEAELVKLVGIERDIAREKLSAEEALKRKLAPVEAAAIDRIIREIDATERLAEYDDQIIGSLQQQNELLGLNGIAREVRAEQMRAEDVLGRQLTETEAGEIRMLVKANDELQRQADILESIRGPVNNYMEDIRSLTILLEKGAISQREFNVAKNELALERDVFGVESSLDGTLEQRAAEIEEVRRSAEAKQLIIDQAEQAGVRSAQQAANLRIAVARDEERKIRAIRTAQRSADIQAAKSTFDSLTSIAKDFAGEQSGIYKAMFVVSKAFAIADSIVKIQQGIANALSLPFPANLGAVAAVAAQAASIVSNIKAVTLAFADGGYVSGPGGSRDDAIMARLSNGEFVVNAEATRRNRPLLEAINSGAPVRSGARPGSLRPANDSGGIHIGQIQINYQSDGKNPKEDAEIMADEFERRVRNITRDELADQSRGGGALTQSSDSALVA